MTGYPSDRLFEEVAYLAYYFHWPLAEILRVVTEAGTSVSAVSVEEPDLEAVFLHLTGKALRD